MTDHREKPYLSSELQLQEDQTLQFQSPYTTSGEIMKPPGVQTLEEWGEVRAPSGKHPGKTFAEIYSLDQNYAFQLKHRRGVSAWVRSFQMYTKARLEVSNKILEKERQMPVRPAKTSMARMSGNQETEDWISVPEGSQSGASASSKPELKRRAEEEQGQMTVEQDQHRVMELKTQIAILQRELELQTQGSKETEKM
jgi:hypothetical protein